MNNNNTIMKFLQAAVFVYISHGRWNNSVLPALVFTLQTSHYKFFLPFNDKTCFSSNTIFQPYFVRRRESCLMCFCTSLCSVMFCYILKKYQDIFSQALHSSQHTYFPLFALIFVRRWICFASDKYHIHNSC